MVYRPGRLCDRAADDAMAQAKQPRSIEGDLTAQGASFGIVVSRFNSFITEKLLAGALDAIARSGGDLGAVSVAKVPGALELAVAAKTMAATDRMREPMVRARETGRRDEEDDVGRLGTTAVARRPAGFFA